MRLAVTLGADERLSADEGDSGPSASSKTRQIGVRLEADQRLSHELRLRAGFDTQLEGYDVVHEDGSRSQPDAVIAATGYDTGLTPLLGPLGLVDRHGMPTVGSQGSVAAPSLYSVGVTIQLSGLLRGRTPITVSKEGVA